MKMEIQAEKERKNNEITEHFCWSAKQMEKQN